MKSIFQTCFCLALYFVFFACASNKPKETPTVALPPTIHPLPNATATIMDATAIHSTFVAASSWPPLTPLPTLGFPAPVVTSNPLTPSSTPLPDFAPAEIPDLLQSTLRVEVLSDFNGHSLQRISGWKFGFRGLEWMDRDHLLLYPVTGGDIEYTEVYPAVANLASKKFWIPLPSTRGGDLYPTLPRWSPRLGSLISSASETSIAVYSPDGKVRKIYEGNFRGISPSVTKLLMDNTWIDLGSGKIINFAWDQTGRGADLATYTQFHPIWSPDEMRVYACCYAFGDARTGVSFVMPVDDVTLDGEKTDFAFLALHGRWVLNGKYVMPWGGLLEGPTLSVYLFDPAAKTFRDLSVKLGIPHGMNPYGTVPYCNMPLAPDGGRYAWVECQDGSYLIDFATLHSKAYPHFGRLYEDSVYAGEDDVDWSADGNFARMDGNGSILSAATQELKPSPDDCSSHEWHPKDNVLLCMSYDGQKLLLVDARTVSVLRETTLPGKFSMMGWSPNGKHFALLAGDNSFWQIDYPKLDNLEQVTSAMPELTSKTYNTRLIRNVIWSADNSAIAFIGAQDIYIVQADSRP